jgi:hypothetical protein
MVTMIDWQEIRRMRLFSFDDCPDSAIPFNNGVWEIK